jgi:RimJ/RimL family protein N-acetyltransferase
VNNYQISPLSEENALTIITWQYPPPYDLYDLSPESLSVLLNPAFRYHQVLDMNGRLVGYCCFGEDAQVPGGNYHAGEPGKLDVGIGLMPDLTGKGLGFDFVKEILEFAERSFYPEVFRVTVAEFNQRSLSLFIRLGFRKTYSFTRDLILVDFVQLERPVKEAL